MKTFALRRSVISLIAIITTFLAIAGIGAGKFTVDVKDDHKHAGHRQTQHKKAGPAPRTDGTKNPELIPDAAAYEILFKLLSTTDPTEQKIELRKAAYLREAGFNSAEAAAISNAAYEYKRQIESLDTEVDNIKNQHWPRPSQAVMNQLTQLQRKKEAVIAEIVSGLQTQLNNYHPSKLGDHMLNKVKRKTKGFPTALPDQKIGSLRNPFADMFTVSAAPQAPGCDAQVYMYNDVTIDWSGFTVYGSGSYSLPYNNCGHTVTLSTEIWGGGYYNTGGSGTYISLEYASNRFLDGYFMSTTNGEGYCPVASQTFPTGSMTDDNTVAPFLRVHPFGSWNPASHTVANGPASIIPLRVTPSDNATGSYNIELSYVITQGSGTVNIVMAGGGNKSSTGGVSVEHNCQYRAFMITSNPTRIKAEASVTSSMEVRNGNQISSAICTITP